MDLHVQPAEYCHHTFLLCRPSVLLAVDNWLVFVLLITCLEGCEERRTQAHRHRARVTGAAMESASCKVSMAMRVGSRTARRTTRPVWAATADLVDTVFAYHLGEKTGLRDVGSQASAETCPKNTPPTCHWLALISPALLRTHQKLKQMDTL